MAKKWNKRRVSRDIIILLIVLAAAVMAPVAYLASQARRDISERFIHDASNQAINQFRAMSGSMESTLGLVRDWGATGALSLDKTEELATRLFPLFGREPLLDGVSVADIDGKSFYAQLDGEGYRTRLVEGGGDKRTASTTYWTSDFEPTSNDKTNSVYDPRNRAWFAPALATEEVVWSDPYAFYSSGKIGVTASISFPRKEDGKAVVIAFDILLNDVFDKMRAISPSPNSQIFIFRRDARIYIPETESLPAGFVALSSLENELVRRAHASWFGGTDLSGKVVSLLHEGEIWWGGFRPLDGARGSAWICVLVPERDILPHAGKRAEHLWLIALASILAATGLAFWMIRRYGKTAGATEAFDAENPAASVRRIIAGGENRYVEFKSTMRMNLHAKKPGKEIETAWMKGVAGFLNTDGGILLLGVTDEGEITGLERDVFENEDKCRLHFKNLVSKHIGADHSKYIRFHVVPMDGLTVGVVRCERSSDPVFMKDGNKEHFYIRNGPSSDELPVSQALNYIKHRGK